MKKYISLIVCAVLLIASLTMGAATDTDVAFGRGKGNDAKITNVGQFVDVLDFFNNYQIEDANEASVGNSGFAASSAKNEYTSATLAIKTRATQDYYSSNNGYSASSKSSITRELTICLTKTSAYYKSVGLVMENRSQTSSNGETKKATSVLDFDMEIYITAEKCYIKLNKFDMTSVVDGEEEDVQPFKASIIGKWVDADEFAVYFLSINQENYELLGRMGDYFDGYKTTDFNVDSGIYRIKEDKLNEALSIIMGSSMPEEMKGEFTLNLSNSVRPTVKLVQSYDQSEYEDYSLTQVLYAENNIAFSNINNTVVEFKAQRIYDIEDYVNEEVFD